VIVDSWTGGTSDSSVEKSGEGVRSHLSPHLPQSLWSLRASTYDCRTMFLQNQSKWCL